MKLEIEVDEATAAELRTLTAADLAELVAVGRWLTMPLVREIAAIERMPRRARDAFAIHLSEAVETAMSVAEYGGD